VSEEKREAVLDEALDSVGVDAQFAEQLFAVVDALDSSVALRRAVTDPAASEDRRSGLVHALFDPRVSPPVAAFVADAARRRWTTGRVFVDALEREAVRARLRAADADGTLDDTEDGLFRFARIVASDRDLRAALSDRVVPLEVRQQLVQDLLAERATPATLALARRAVAAKQRSFDHTVESYVDLAAAQKDRVVATVRVARPMTDEQRQRLRAALSRQAGRDVVLQEVVDPDVVGGVRVDLGDEVLEGTVASKLDEARRLFG
jgi:F-type H+-transporting ATPase subunit delta